MSALVNPAAAAARNKALLRALPWVAILAVWQGVRSAGLVSPGLLPSPPHILVTAWGLLLDGSLLRHVGASAGRVTLGVLIGVTLAVPAGFALGRFAAVRAAFDPLVNFFRALPLIALVPLVIVYLGIGEAAKIFVLAFSAFFAAVIVLYEGVSQIAPIYTQVAQTLGATQGEIFRKVILPAAAPHVLTALRVSLGVAWATLVAAELVAAQAGLGAMIQMAASFFQLEVIYVGVIAIGLVALSMDYALRRLADRLLAWREGAPL